MLTNVHTKTWAFFLCKYQITTWGCIYMNMINHGFADRQEKISKICFSIYFYIEPNLFDFFICTLFIKLKPLSWSAHPLWPLNSLSNDLLSTSKSRTDPSSPPATNSLPSLRKLPEYATSLNRLMVLWICREVGL